MEEQTSYILDWLGRPTYGVSAYLIFNPLATVFTAAWPLDPGSVVWRYGAEGNLSGFLISVLMGFLIAAVVAVGLRHRLVLRMLAVTNVVVAVVLVVLSVDYALNGLQIRAQVTSDSMWGFKLGVMRGVLAMLVTAALLGWIALASRNAAKRLAEAFPTQTESPHPLVSI